MRNWIKIALLCAALTPPGTALAQQSFGPPAVQPISASSLPLPSGAATASNQTTGNTSLSTIATNTGATNTTLGTTNTSLSTIATNTGNTATLLGTTNSDLAAINTTLGTPFQAGGSIGNTTFASTQSGAWNIGLTGTLPAFASPPTVNIGTAPSFAVTGTFWQSTQPVSIATMPSTPVTGTFWQTTQPVSGAASGFADGWDVTEGTKSDTAWTSGAGSVVAILKGLDRDINAPLPGAVTTAAPSYTSGTTAGLSLTTGGALRGDIASYNSTALTGTVTAYGTAPTGNVFGVNAYVTNTVPVTGTFWQTTQPVSGSVSLSGTLPAFAATPAVTISSGTVTTVSTVTSVSKIGGNTPTYSISAGSTNLSAGVTIGTAVSQVDQNATAFAGSGSVLGTLVASAQGGGAVVSAEINVSALTLGTATSVFAILQESTGGTNFSDIWVSNPITATGIVRMPAIPVSGRRRWRFFSVGGTSTTVTATITSLELPSGYPVQRQMRDAYAATNPFALQYNSAALTASNLVLGTLSTATTPFYVGGTKQLTAFMVLAGSPTVTTQPVVTLQLSMDGTNWWNVSGATMTAAGNGAYATTSQSVGGAEFARLIVTTAAAYSAAAYTVSNMGVNAVN